MTSKEIKERVEFLRSLKGKNPDEIWELAHLQELTPEEEEQVEEEDLDEIHGMSLEDKVRELEDFLWDLDDCPKRIKMLWNSIAEEIGY